MVRNSLAFLTFAAALVFTGCEEREVFFTGDQVIQASNDAGVNVKILSVKQKERYLELDTVLENDGEQTVVFQNRGDHLTAFVARANGRTEAGHLNFFRRTELGINDSSQITLLPKNSRAIQLKFHWDPNQPTHLYDWKLTVTNMVGGDGKSLGDIELSETVVGAVGSGG